MRIELAEKKNACGTCTLCCKVMQVSSLNKPKDVWCSHAQHKVGCGIYETRPEACSAFNCVWLTTAMPMAYRPDKIHGVMNTNETGDQLAIHEDAGYPGVASHALSSVIDAFIAKPECYVVVVTGDQRRLIAKPELAKRLMAKAEEASV
jgi:coenzyme F420-reducing hydrogenase beta subunit